MTYEEKKQNLVKVLGNALAERLEKNCPITAAFTPYCVQFPVIGTKNEGRLQLTYKDPGQVLLQLGVYRKGTNRLYSHFLPASTGEEMIRYLRDPASHQDWLEQIRQLSDSVDDYWD